MQQRIAFAIAVALVILTAFALPTAQAAGLAFDGNGHFLIHGTPAFLRGAYDSGIGPYDSVPAWETALFTLGGDVRATRGLLNTPLNIYLNYHRGADTSAQINALMDDLANHQVLWLQTTNCYSSTSYTSLPFSTEVIPGFIAAIRGNTQLAGYYIMDECDDSLIPETQTHHHTLLTADPQSLTFAVPIAYPSRNPTPWTKPANGQPTASFFGTDPYVIYGSDKGAGYPHFMVADEIARLRDSTPQAVPVMGVLQFFKFGGGGRLPTYDEMRMHVYSAIVEGAQGLFWWELGENGLRQSTTKVADIQRMMGYLQTLVTELRDLEPGLLAAANPALANIVDTADPVAWRLAAVQRDMQLVKRASYAAVQWYDYERMALSQVPPDLTLSPMLHDPNNPTVLKSGVQSHDVRYRASAANGVGYLIAYNYSNLTQTVTFSWNAAAGSISRVGETATAPTLSAVGTPNQFTDTFAPFQVHVYQLQ